jgi:transcription elongation factor GreA
MNKKIEITGEGLKSLKKELAELVDVKRIKVVDRLANARSQGDLAENSDYHNAKDELEFIDGRISELEDVLEHSVLVTSNGKSGSVSVGTTVVLKVGSLQHTFSIVGEWEADPAQKKISHTSPLGQALVGRKVGERVEVEAPAGKVIYEILSIN